jgi:hypothetical protein
LHNHPPRLNESQQILLLTNDEISNIEETINLYHKMVTHTGIFTVDLGLSPNRALIKGLAGVINGKSTLVPPDAKVKLDIADQLQRILQPSFNNINIRYYTYTFSSVQASKKKITETSVISFFENLGLSPLVIVILEERYPIKKKL